MTTRCERCGDRPPVEGEPTCATCLWALEDRHPGRSALALEKLREVRGRLGDELRGGRQRQAGERRW